MGRGIASGGTATRREGGAMNEVMMEQEDFIRLKDAEIAALQEELIRERARREAAEKGEELAIGSGLQWQRKYHEARKQLQSWADFADEEIKLAALRRAEVEALEL
jgi:hypothetical protein